MEENIREVEVLEKFLDTSEFDSNNNLIRMDMNVIEFPIFSKNNKLKKNQILKYYFSKDKQSYLEITPPADDSIPNEFDERIFIALLKIMKSKGYKKTFYCSLSEIVDNLNLTAEGTKKSTSNKIKSSIIRLSKTIYSFFNLFYLSSLKNKVDDLINTALISSRIITFKDAGDDEKDYFSDKRIKEIYKITIADDIYSNVVNKGYLVFDADELLNIKDSVIRSLYTQITKWRNNELYIKRPAFFIAKKIPLSWSGSMVFKTVNKIKNSLEYLKKEKLIANYNIIRGKKVENTEFEMFFDEEHNKYKQENFYKEIEDFNNIIHSVEERVVNNSLFLENKDTEILKIFGEKGEKLKTLPSAIREALKNYEFDYVKYTAEYTTLNCKISYIKYFKEALINNWADEYIVSKKERENKKIKQESKIIEEAVIIEEKHVENNYVWEEFTALDEEFQRKIENDTYLNFLKEAEGTDNKIMRGIFEKSKKSLILKDLKNYIDKEEIVEVELKESIGIEVTFINLNHFIGEILEKAVRQGIIFDKIKIENINMLLSVLGQYEDTFMKVSWNEEHKKGMLILK